MAKHYKKLGDKSYCDGAPILCYGEVFYVKHTSGGRDHIDFEEGLIVINMAKGQKTAKEKVLSLLKGHLLSLLYDLVTEYADLYGVTYKVIRVKNIKSRWGSCSSLKNLNFNLQLAGAPIDVIRYIVVHEVCHLKFLDHSREFWDLVSLVFPDYKAYRQWLKTNGYKLNLDIYIIKK